MENIQISQEATNYKEVYSVWDEVSTHTLEGTMSEAPHYFKATFIKRSSYSLESEWLVTKVQI